MKQLLKDNQGLPPSLLWTLAIMAGISVANIYYNQPLLNRISRDLAISEFSANMITVITQIGYALGLLFIIPLGDLIKRKNIVLTCFSILVLSLLTIASSPNFHLILVASLLTGACSVMPQLFIPIAAQYTRDKRAQHGPDSFRTAYRYIGFARGEWHYGRIFRLAIYILCRRRCHGRLLNHYLTHLAGHAYFV
jgi:MFS family permease